MIYDGILKFELISFLASNQEVNWLMASGNILTLLTLLILL